MLSLIWYTFYHTLRIMHFSPIVLFKTTMVLIVKWNAQLVLLICILWTRGTYKSQYIVTLSLSPVMYSSSSTVLDLPTNICCQKVQSLLHSWPFFWQWLWFKNKPSIKDKPQNQSCWGVGWCWCNRGGLSKFVEYLI